MIELHCQSPLASSFLVRCGRRAVVALLLSAAATPAFASVPDYGYQWSTIGNPGNRGSGQEFRQWHPNKPEDEVVDRGSVDHVYRIAKTEVTSNQWIEFLNAYRAFNPGAWKVDTTGTWIFPSNSNHGSDVTFYVPPAYANSPINPSWRMAARYCNWLSNGKADTAAAFESGAYDTSTFTQNPDGSLSDQLRHSPGATFWIPTLDEWVKAAYYDPNKYGQGMEGYWQFVNSSDQSTINYTFGGVQQTNAAVGPYPGEVASYAPMGPAQLYDVSGGATEWLEDLAEIPRADSRLARHAIGSSVPYGPVYDQFGYWYSIAGSAYGPSEFGLRLASAVPAPTTFVMTLLIVAGWKNQRRYPSSRSRLH